MIHIRDATAADAAQLAEFAERSFRAAFARFNAATDMDAHCRGSFSPEQQAAEIAAGDMRTLLVEAADILAGFAQLRMRAAPACVVANRPTEIQRFYVDQRWHGQGVATKLIQRAIERARREGADAVWLGVWERNPRAIAFYGKHGFRAVGGQTFQLGSDPQRDLVMTLAIGAGGIDV